MRNHKNKLLAAAALTSLLLLIGVAHSLTKQDALSAWESIEGGDITIDDGQGAVRLRFPCNVTLPGECPSPAKVKVGFSEIGNRGEGDMAPYIFAGPDAVRYGENEWIPLTDANGNMMIDGGKVYDVPGLAFERGRNRIFVGLYGSHPRHSRGWEKAYGNIQFEGAVVAGFKNDNSGGKVERQGDGIYSDNVGQDEVFYSLGSDEAEFYLTVGPHNDGFYLGYSCRAEEECGECDGKVAWLTLGYDGTMTSSIKVVQKNGDVVFDSPVPPGGSFTFYGTDRGALGPSITIYVDYAENTKIHTSCSEPIGAGMVSGDFTILDGASRNGGTLCPIEIPPPSEDCECDGGIKVMEMQTALPYAGGTVTVEARAARKGRLDSDPYGVDIETFSGTPLTSGTFSGAVAITGILSNGTHAIVTFVVDAERIGKAKRGSEADFRVRVNGAQNEVRIHTSCSQPIGPPFVFGDFTVLSFTDRHGGVCIKEQEYHDDGNTITGYAAKDPLPGPKKRRKGRCDGDRDGYYPGGLTWYKEAYCSLLRYKRGDCDDNNAQANPGSGEIYCNGVDENCNPSDDEGTDDDRDSYRAAGKLCGPLDCDDSDPSVYPGAEEVCNSIDDDCDGKIDEPKGLCSDDSPPCIGEHCGKCLSDADCDDGLYCNGKESCRRGSCREGKAPDCKDHDSCTSDICNEDTGSCDNTPIDSDGDGYSICEGVDRDCDDNDPDVNAGAVEICDNGMDDNCNWLADMEDPECSECGNEIQEEGEECDDGNTVGGDGCSAYCTVEYCGDGIVQPGLGEECDDGNTVGGDGCSIACRQETDPDETCPDFLEIMDSVNEVSMVSFSKFLITFSVKSLDPGSPIVSLYEDHYFINPFEVSFGPISFRSNESGTISDYLDILNHNSIDHEYIRDEGCVCETRIIAYGPVRCINDRVIYHIWKWFHQAPSHPVKKMVHGVIKSIIQIFFDENSFEERFGITDTGGGRFRIRGGAEIEPSFIDDITGQEPYSIPPPGTYAGKASVRRVEKDFDVIIRPAGRPWDPLNCFKDMPECTDDDRDGYNAEGESCGLTDCNDDEASVNPGALEGFSTEGDASLCEGIDNNCDGDVDDGCPVCAEEDEDDKHFQTTTGTPRTDDDDKERNILAVKGDGSKRNPDDDVFIILEDSRRYNIKTDTIPPGQLITGIDIESTELVPSALYIPKINSINVIHMMEGREGNDLFGYSGRYFSLTNPFRWIYLWDTATVDNAGDPDYGGFAGLGITTSDMIKIHIDMKPVECGDDEGDDGSRK